MDMDMESIQSLQPDRVFTRHFPFLYQLPHFFHTLPLYIRLGSKWKVRNLLGDGKGSQ